MKFGNKLTKSFATVVMVGVCLSTSAFASSQTSAEIKSNLDEAITMRNTAHQLAECARTLGAEEDDFIILHAKDKWDEHNETVVALTEDYNKALNAEREAEAKRKAEEEAKRKAEEAKRGRLVARMKCTFYTGSADEGGSITALGTPVTPWYTVAVDPRVIPLGSKIRIEGFNGVFYCADTGGAIKGNIIDIAVGSKSEASNLGVQYRNVYIVN
jgi:3D (Asp-Asp-Asp) domain-containing protein